MTAMDTVEIFPWNENLETGLPEIDAQHRRLVQLLNLLASHIAYLTDLPALDNIFDELADYAVYHFSSEEAVWHEFLTGDQWEKGHRTLHQDFVTEVQRLKAEGSNKPSEEVAEEVLSFLCHWLAFHILDSDKRMAKAVLAVRDGCSVEEAKQRAELGMSGAVKVLVETVLSMYETLSNRTLHLMKEIIARQKAEAKLRLAANVFDHTLESIGIVDPDGIIVEANPAFCASTGLSYDDVIGQPLSRFKTSLGDEAAFVWAAAEQSGHWSGELSSRSSSGALYHEWLTLSAVRNEQGALVNYVAVFSNVEQLLKRERILEHMANHDGLTGLPNRLLLADRMELALATAERQGERLAVCFVDLDGFKPINDAFGHATGDQVLKIVAERLKALLRGSDTVARMGGDEFVILVGGLKQAGDCQAFLERLQQTIDSPIPVANGIVRVSASIGVSVFPHDGSDADELLKHADEAMYLAKRAGKARFVLYSGKESADVRD